MTEEQSAALDALEAINKAWLADRDTYLSVGASSATLGELTAQLDAFIDDLKARIAAYQAEQEAITAEAARVAALPKTGLSRSGVPIKLPQGATLATEDK